MHFFTRRPWDLPQSRHTPEAVYRERRWHRREFLAGLGRGAVGLGIGGLFAGCTKPASDAEIVQAGAVEPPPAEFTDVYSQSARNTQFEYGRPETPRRAAAEWTNFYEFTGPYSKESWRFVEKFEPTPWSVTVDGLCAHPGTFDLDDLHRAFSFEERAYRHRCVETWAMCVPWIGFQLADLLKTVEPKPSAKYVVFETFNRPDQAPYIGEDPSYPWPYVEGLTIAEATNELTLLATGVYGEPLPKQHGAPVRLVVPWKYGFKSGKSIVKITLADKAPATFWNTVAPHEYAFEANVDPDVPHPRWSQRTEWMLGTRERYPTQVYNGYGEFVGGLYG